MMAEIRRADESSSAMLSAEWGQGGFAQTSSTVIAHYFSNDCGGQEEKGLPAGCV